MGGEPDEHTIDAKDQGGYKKEAWAEAPSISGWSWELEPAQKQRAL